MSILLKGVDYRPPRKPNRVYLVYYFEDETSNFSHSICVTDNIVEVPKHGRLIDADALIAVMIGTLEVLRKNPKMDNQEAHLIAAFHTVGDMVNHAPTVIEAEGEEK